MQYCLNRLTFHRVMALLFLVAVRATSILCCNCRFLEAKWRTLFFVRDSNWFGMMVFQNSCAARSSVLHSTKNNTCTAGRLKKRKDDDDDDDDYHRKEKKNTVLLF